MRVLLIPLLAGCNLGLQVVPSLTDSGYPSLNTDDTGTDDGDSGDNGGGGGGGGGGGEDCVDNDFDGVDTCSGDCDDNDSNTYPGAAEADSNTACMTDADNDGYGSDSPANGVTAGTDCNDANSTLNPGEDDVPFDGNDTNCDGEDGSIVTANGEGNLTVADYATVNSNATVSGCAQVYNATISVNISHTYQGDLTVSLTPPSGQSFLLHNRTGGTTDNIVGSYATSGGTIVPAQSLLPLVGSNGNGNWRLTVSDAASGDSGRLNSWSVELECP